MHPLTLRITRNAAVIGLLPVLLVLGGCDRPKTPDAPPPPALTREPVAPDPQKSAWFGELHLHTTYSLDANIFGTRVDPREAFRFAQGEAVWLPESGQYQQLRTPLDFAAITDHAETLGMYRQCYSPDSETYWLLSCLGIRHGVILMFGKLTKGLKQEGAVKGHYDAGVCGEDGALCRTAALDQWREVQTAANEANKPGTFTSFIAM